MKTKWTMMLVLASSLTVVTSCGDAMSNDDGTDSFRDSMHTDKKDKDRDGRNSGDSTDMKDYPGDTI